MAAFNFPNSPSTNDVHTENGVSWKWNGTVWKKVASPDTIAKADSKVQVVDAGTGGYITAETDGTQRLRIQNSGAIVTGILTATSFKGDGSALTGITDNVVTINNNANNRLITGSGTANTLEAEATLTYDGTILEVSNATPKLKLTDSDATGTPEVLVDGSGGDLILDVDKDNEKGSTLFAVKLDGSEKLRITSTGLMGLGTNSPNTKLDVVSSPINATTVNTTTCKQLGLWINPAGTGNNTTGNIYNGIALSDGFAGLYGYDAGASAATGLGFFTGNASAVAERLRIASTGQVLIGTTTEGHSNADELTVSKSTGVMGMTLRSDDSSNCHFYFSDATSGAGEYAGFINYQHSDNSLHIGANSAERLRIDSSGRLLLGLTSTYASSSEKLSVSGMVSIQKASTSTAGLYIFNTETTSDGTVQPFLFMHDGGGNRGGFGLQRSTSNLIINGQTDIQFRTGASGIAGTEKLRIASNGDVKVTSRGSSTSGAPLYVAVTGKSSITYGGGQDDTACLRIVDNGSTNSYYHGIELRTRQGGDVRLYAQDQGNDVSDFVIATDNSSLIERFRIKATGHAYFKETVGIRTDDVTRANLANPVGAGHSLVGMYIGDGSLLFNNTLNRTGGYYISTETNALNAGPVTLDANMKVDGAWVIV